MVVNEDEGLNETVQSDESQPYESALKYLAENGNVRRNRPGTSYMVVTLRCFFLLYLIMFLLKKGFLQMEK